jgi:hypothetical protein
MTLLSIDDVFPKMTSVASCPEQAVAKPPRRSGIQSFEKRY